MGVNLAAVRALLEECDHMPVDAPGLEVLMNPQARADCPHGVFRPTCGHCDSILHAAESREQLAATVRPNGSVVLFLRAPGRRPSRAWEIQPEEWLKIATRIARAVAKPERFGGAVLVVGVERAPRSVPEVDRVDPEDLERLLALVAEPEP
jgi:hypothetical protein